MKVLPIIIGVFGPHDLPKMFGNPKAKVDVNSKVSSPTNFIQLKANNVSWSNNQAKVKYNSYEGECLQVI
jgi:hypothetical protein